MMSYIDGLMKDSDFNMMLLIYFVKFGIADDKNVSPLQNDKCLHLLIDAETESPEMFKSP